MRDDDDDMDDHDAYHAEIPTSFREQRACMTCSLVKTFTQFYDQGCDNCTFLQMAENRQRVSDCTSPYFEGLIAMMQPRQSWCAKWQRIAKYKPGIYAVTVSGELPPNIRQYLDERNIHYKVKD